MKTNNGVICVMMRKICAAAFVAALFCTFAINAQAQTAWENAVNGYWDDTGKWSLGVPDGNAAQLTAVGASYEVAYTNADAAFEGMSIVNEGSDTTTLRISAPDFQGNITTGDRTTDLGLGARVIVEEGGVWNMDGTNTSAESYQMQIVNGGNLLVQGGDIVWTNLMANHRNQVTVNIGQGSAGVMTLDGGTVTIGRTGDNSGDYHILNVGTDAGGHGTLNVSNGTMLLQTLTGVYWQFGVAGANNSTGIVNVTGGELDIGPAYWTLGYGGGRGEINVSGNGIFKAGSRLEVGEKTGYGILNMDGGELSTGHFIHVGKNGGTGLYNQTGGKVTMGGSGFYVAYEDSQTGTPTYGTAVIEGGWLATRANGIHIGRRDKEAGYETHGVLTVTNNGLLTATSITFPGQYAWTPHQGILVGEGSTDGGANAEGEFRMAGGTTTNDGQLIMGLYVNGVGQYVQTDGSYQHIGNGAVQKRHAIVGYGGGTGTAKISGGSFKITLADLYIGGVDQSVYSWVPDIASTGTFEVAGGTVDIVNDAYVGQAGKGTLTIGDGELSVNDLNLVSSDATLGFNFSDGDIGDCNVSGTLTIDPDAKLEIDPNGAVGNVKYTLVSCGARSGSFDSSNIIVIDGDSAWVDQDTDNNIYFKIQTGTVIMIR